MLMHRVGICHLHMRSFFCEELCTTRSRNHVATDVKFPLWSPDYFVAPNFRASDFDVDDSLLRAAAVRDHGLCGGGAIGAVVAGEVGAVRGVVAGAGVASVEARARLPRAAGAAHPLRTLFRRARRVADGSAPGAGSAR